jgi:hypothetical protein
VQIDDARMMCALATNLFERGERLQNCFFPVLIQIKIIKTWAEKFLRIEWSKVKTTYTKNIYEKML